MEQNGLSEKEIQCNRDNKQHFMDKIQLLFIFVCFAYLVGKSMRYTNCVMNAHFQIIYKGCGADMFLEGSWQANK